MFGRRSLAVLVMTLLLVMVLIQKQAQYLQIMNTFILGEEKMLMKNLLMGLPHSIQ